MLARYAAVDAYNISVNTEESTLDALFAQLKAYNTLIISFGKASDQEELNNNLSTLLRKLSARTTLLKVLFHEVGSQEALEKDFRYQGVLLAHNATATAQDLAAQALFGAFAIRGKWAGQGIEAPSAGRLKFTVPEELGIDRHYIRLADSLAAQVVRSKAAPGCQVLAAKDAKVFYFKTFGYHTYDSLQPVKPDDIYDLASVTKISTSAAALMRLHDKERFQLDETWGRLDRRVRKSNKDSLTFRQLLIHRAGLAAWIPFWKNYVDTDGRLNSEIFSADSSGRYRDKVAEGIFIRRGFASRELIGSIVASPVDTKKNYVYSDLSYYMYPGMLRRLAGRSFERFLQEEFYHRLGANTLVFNPLQHFPRSRIVPTEYDSLFRKQLIHGTVHDEGAAMFGGISGHAGLFGHAIDVAKLMQMYLNKGIYGGERYLEAATIEEFTRCQFCPDERQNRQQRAIAFDKNRFVGNAPASASAASYGHSGFTGTFTWNEPENGLLFVFLSNRVYPTRNNNRISQYNFRTDLNEIFYQAIKYAYKVP
jgi:CubicO group peptidase (beta-lactamase class C family)